MKRVSVETCLRSSVATLAFVAALGMTSSAVRAESIDELKQDIARLQKQVERLELQEKRAALQDKVRRHEGREDRRAAPAAQPGGDIAAATREALGAYAADMPVKAAPIVPYFNWSGFYAGINAGYSVGRDRTNHVVCATNFCSDDTFKVSPVGVIGGVQAGFNWQWSPNWVFGIEADVQASGQKDTACIFICEPGRVVFTTIERSLNWFSTLRGRVGYAENGWLLYATGGGAVGEVQTNVSAALVGGITSTSKANDHDVKGGYTVGGGLETQFSGGWSGKIEYLYMALGTVSSQVTLLGRSGPISSDIRDHIIRVGLNHRFGGSGGAYSAYAADKSIAYKAAPVVTALDWTGPYLGINVGYGVGRNPSRVVDAVDTAIFGHQEFGAEQVPFSPAGIVAGGQAGFNWQRGVWVIGAEVDVQGTGQKDRICEYSCSSNTYVITTQSLDWFATLRGRVGVAASGWLWYVTAGGAAAQVKNSVAMSFNQNGQPAVAFGNFSNLKGGWTAGVGVEAQFAGNWSWKVEYLYLDLGRVDTSITAVGLIGPETVTSSSDVRNHVFRAGVNYRFGGAGPVAAAY